MPAARARRMLARRLAPLAVLHESAATAEPRGRAWTRGDPCLRREHHLRVRSWGLRRKRARGWGPCLTGGLHAGRVFMGMPS
jgi:hypothetical protein